MNGFLNDGSTSPPAMRVYMNLANLESLRADSAWHRTAHPSRDARLAADGFDGVQLVDDEPPADGSTLPYCGLGRVNLPAEADPLLARRVDRGDSCVTLHVGWGTEDDDQVDRLVEAVLEASRRRGLPAFVETHRATVTQDMWRTVRITRKFPEIRFNGDFSHYYCGQELVYGDWSAKLTFLQPIFDRIGFMHGRIASPGCMQVPVDRDVSRRPVQAHGAVDYLSHFRELWTRAMAGFLTHAAAGDVLIFAPELLAPTHYYARMVPASGGLVEETDRYEQAVCLRQIAMDCFNRASSVVPAKPRAGDKGL